MPKSLFFVSHTDKRDPVISLKVLLVEMSHNGAKLLRHFRYLVKSIAVTTTAPIFVAKETHILIRVIGVDFDPQRAVSHNSQSLEAEFNQSEELVSILLHVYFIPKVEVLNCLTYFFNLFLYHEINNHNNYKF